MLTDDRGTDRQTEVHIDRQRGVGYAEANKCILRE
jgi:hypothetical protein